MAESEFLDLMPHTVTRQTYASISGYGKPSYSTGVTSIRALVQYEHKLVRAMDGTEKISTANALLSTTAVLNAQDRLTLPDGTVPPILSIQRLSDTGGQHHVDVYFG